jgi:hypothetical protein
VAHSRLSVPRDELQPGRFDGSKKKRTPAWRAFFLNFPVLD